MLNRPIRNLVLGLGLALAPLSAFAGTGEQIDSATVYGECVGYTLTAMGENLQPNDRYEVKYHFTVERTAGAGIPGKISGTLPVTVESNGEFSNSHFVAWGPLPRGAYTFLDGRATLYDLTTQTKYNSVTITFTPTTIHCHKLCSQRTQNTANFNGTPINPGTFIWFNGNFTAKNIPQTGATVFWSHQTIEFTAGGIDRILHVPNSEIVFTPNVSCSTTTYDPNTKTWITSVPVKGDDEVFMAGLSYHVPSNFGTVTTPVTWSATYSSKQALGSQWKWGAAVYSQFTRKYNDLMVKAGHQTSCAYNNGDHAGTPEGTDKNGTPWKQFVIGGATGGGGSNFTGSWSGTTSTTPVCNK